MKITSSKHHLCQTPSEETTYSALTSCGRGNWLDLVVSSLLQGQRGCGLHWALGLMGGELKPQHKKPFSCIPTNSVGGFPFLHTLSSIYCLQIFGSQPF